MLSGSRDAAVLTLEASARASKSLRVRARLWDRAATLWHELGRDQDAARCLIERAGALQKLNLYPEAQAASEQALALVEVGDAPILVADAKRILSIALRHLGQDQHALEINREASDIYREHGREDRVALCASNASHILRDRGEFHRANVDLEAAIAAVADIDAPWKSMLFNTLSSVRKASGDRDGALAAIREAVAIAERHGQVGRRAAALSNLAGLTRLVGDSEGALVLYDQVVDLCRDEPNLKNLYMNTYLNMSVAERHLGKLDLALEHAAQALQYFERRRPQRRNSAHSSLGRTYAAMGRHDDALRHLRAAWRYYKKRGHGPSAARIRFAMGRVMIDRHPGEPAEMRKVLGYWVPTYLELDAARFQFPTPRERHRWQVLLAPYRADIFDLAVKLQDSELIADLLESSIHSGAYVTSDGSGGVGVIDDDGAGGGDGPDDEPPTGEDDHPAVTMGGAVSAIVGSELPMRPTPPLKAPYGRVRLARYRPNDPSGEYLRTW